MLFGLLDRSQQSSFWYETVKQHPACDVKTIVDQTYDSVRQERGWGSILHFFLEGFVKWWIRGSVQTALSAWKFDHIQNVHHANVQEDKKNYTYRERDAKAILNVAKNEILNNNSLLGKLPRFKQNFIKEGLENLAERGSELLRDCSSSLVAQSARAFSLQLTNPIDTTAARFSEAEKAIIAFDPCADLFAELLAPEQELTLQEKASRWDRFVAKYSSDPKQILIDRVTKTLFHNSRAKRYLAASEANDAFKDFTAAVKATAKSSTAPHGLAQAAQAILPLLLPA